MSEEQKKEQGKGIPRNAWLKLDHFVLEGKCIYRRPGASDQVAAEWHIPARAGLAVIGAILRQLFMCWSRIIRQNTKVALRWLFWQA